MTDLEWLARIVDLNGNYEFVKKSKHTCVIDFYSYRDPGSYSKAEVDAERERLINRPKFEDHHSAQNT